jgi:hypothetical protein
MACEDRPWSPERRAVWLAAIDRWLDDALTPLGEAREVELVKDRPWGAVLRVRTTERALYLKAVGPRGRHEVALLRDIALRSPGLAPDVLAVHEHEGWLLMPDHGRAIAEQGDIAAQVDAVEAVLPGYAVLQRSCEPMVDGWIEAGAPDRSVARLPEQLDRLLGGGGALGPVDLDGAELRRAEELLATFEGVCEQLATSDVPRSIDHADLHGWNVVVGAGTPRLIDWGDACITHPFSSLLVPIEWVAARLPLDEQPNAVHRLCDGYLDGWGARGDRDQLGLAVWVAYVTRALSNDEQCAGGAPDVVRDGRHEVAALLRTWSAKADWLDRPAELLQPMLEL